MDTSGQERFRAINESYYRRADCCLLVYDISERKSFDECKYYSKKIKEKCKENIVTILLGNKTDLDYKRQIPSEEGANFSLENGYIFMETSCLKNENVADAFQTLIEITNREAIKKKDDNNELILKKKNLKVEKTNKSCC